MVFRESGEALDTERNDQLTEALKLLERVVPKRFITTFILIRVHGHTWRERATELGVRPGAIGYHLRMVQAAIDKLFREAEATDSN